MSGTSPAAATPLGRAVAERALSPSGDPVLDAAVRRLAAMAGDTLVGLVFFGSRRTGAARRDAFSAYDVFVVVEGYRAFYEALRGGGLTGKSPALLALVSGWLPPTQISLRFEDLGLHVKAAVLRVDTYRRETSEHHRDHFCMGRLCQPTRILHFRDQEARGHLLDGLVWAHRETWRWSRPWLSPTFDARAYGLSVLGTSMRWEVRPEPAGRAGALWEVQEGLQAPVFEALLGELAEAGEVAAVPRERGVFAPTRPVGTLEKLRLELYFRRSIVRATSRWLKHTVTFEGWLDYIARKASRHTGEPVVLTDRERRWPGIFLWGRLFAYLRTKNRKGSPR
jgi:hypothetical protein